MPKEPGAVAVAIRAVANGEVPAELQGQPLVLVPISSTTADRGSSLALRWPKTKADLAMLKELLVDTKSLSQAAAAAEWHVEMPPLSPVRPRALAGVVTTAAGAAGGAASGGGEGGGKGSGGTGAEEQEQQKTPLKEQKGQRQEERRQTPQQQQQQKEREQQQQQAQRHTPHKQTLQKQQQHKEQDEQQQGQDEHQQQQEEEAPLDLGAHHADFEELAQQYTLSDNESPAAAAAVGSPKHHQGQQQAQEQLQGSGFLLPEERHKHPLRREQQQQELTPGQKARPGDSSDVQISKPSSFQQQDHRNGPHAPSQQGQQQQQRGGSHVRLQGLGGGPFHGLPGNPNSRAQQLPPGMKVNPCGAPAGGLANGGGYAGAAAAAAGARGAALPGYGSGYVATRAANFAVAGGGLGFLPSRPLQTQVSDPERQRQRALVAAAQEAAQEREKRRLKEQQEQIEPGAGAKDVDEKGENDGLEDGEVSPPRQRRVTPPGVGSDDGTVGESYYHDCVQEEELLSVGVVADSGASAEKPEAEDAEGFEPPAKRRRAVATSAAEEEEGDAELAALAAATAAEEAEMAVVQGTVAGGDLPGVEQPQQQQQRMQGSSRDPRLRVVESKQAVEQPLPQHHHHQQQQPSSGSFSRGTPAVIPGSTRAAGSGGARMPARAPAVSTGGGVSGLGGSFRSPTGIGGGGVGTPGVGLAALVQMLEHSSVAQLLQRLKGVASDGRPGVLSYWPCCVPEGTTMAKLERLR